MCGFNRKRFGKCASKIWKMHFWLKMTYFDQKWSKIDNFFEWWSPDGPQMVPRGPRWSQMVPRGPRWSQMVPRGPQNRGYYNNCVWGACLFLFCQNGLDIGPNRSGMPPDHSQTLLGHFLRKSFFISLAKCPENYETSTGRKTVFFVWLIETLKKKQRASSRLELSRSDELPIFHMEPIVKKHFLTNNDDFMCTSQKLLKLVTASLD